MANTKVGWEKKVNAFSKSEPPVQGLPRLCHAPSGSLNACWTCHVQEANQHFGSTQWFHACVNCTDTNHAAKHKTLMHLVEL